MDTYVFQTRLTNSLSVRIPAESVDAAWKIFDAKINILESMGVFLPVKSAWTIICFVEEA